MTKIAAQGLSFEQSPRKGFRRRRGLLCTVLSKIHNGAQVPSLTFGFAQRGAIPCVRFKLCALGVLDVLVDGDVEDFQRFEEEVPRSCLVCMFASEKSFANFAG